MHTYFVGFCYVMAHIVFVRIGGGIYDGYALCLFVFGTDVCMGESFQDYS